MSDNKIKTVVKHYVKQYLSEIFAEMNLHTLIETTVQEKIDAMMPVLSSRSVSSLMQEEVTTPSRPAPVRKKITAADLGITDQTWKDIYNDTASSDNPILNGEEAGSEELVSESQLERAGLMKDYSKFMNSGGQKKSNSNDSDDMSEAARKRQEMLKKSIVYS